MSANSSFSERENGRKGCQLTQSAIALLRIAVGLTVTAGAASGATLDEIKSRGYIRVAIANEIPAGYADSSGEIKGTGPDVARHVLEQLGFKPENIQWAVVNFSSLIPGLQANRFDMTAAGMAIRPERCQKVIYSEPYGSYGDALLVAKGNPKNLHSYSDFKKPGLKIAVMAGADQLQVMQKLGAPEDNIVTIAANADAVSTISTGRADGYAASANTARELAKKSDKVEVASNFVDPVIDGKEVRDWGGFSFNKDSTDLRDQFNAALSKFMKTDEWKTILSGYGSTPTDIKAVTEKTTEEICSAK